MPKIHVARSKTINAPVEKVYDIVSDLGKWTPWSPWLIMEPEAKVDISNNGEFYEWEGKRVGSGNMRVIHKDENKRVDFDLAFLKPWKSTAKTWMELEPSAGGTKVTWLMDSSLPFFMFFMKNMMLAFIGMDYERGLNLLKDYAEHGEIHSKLEWTGARKYTGGPFVGIEKTISMDKIETAMTADFESLGQWANANSENAKDLVCIYHKFDMVKQIVSYTAAITCHFAPDIIPVGMIRGSQAASKIYTLTHIGPYHHLGNAWTTMHNMMRQKEFRAQKGYHPFELYENSPVETKPNDLRTQINFALK